MSMGHAGAFAIVIEEEDLKKLNLEELLLFYQVVEAAGATVENVANVVMYDDYANEDTYVDNMYYDDDITEDEIVERTRPIIEAYEKLREAFKARTGLELFLSNHNSEDDGDIYDGVSGCFWSLSFSDVYMLTPDAKKLKETIPFEIQHYVVFG